jgi:hypothetical protein
LHLHQWRLEDWERVSGVGQVKLIASWLQEEEAQWMREPLTSVLEPRADDVGERSEPEESQAEQEEQWVLSSWTLAHFCGEQVRTMLRGA